jgi:hypothetical protein
MDSIRMINWVIIKYKKNNKNIKKNKIDNHIMQHNIERKLQYFHHLLINKRHKYTQ